MKPHRFMLFSLGLLILCAGGCAVIDSPPPLPPREKPVPGWAFDAFPINAWLAPYGAANTAGEWQAMADAGYNLATTVQFHAGGVRDPEFRKMLRYAEKAGIGIFPRFPATFYHYPLYAKKRYTPAEVRDLIRETIELHRNEKAIVGYEIRDEPSAQALPQIKLWLQAQKELDPTRLPYINIYPDWAWEPYEKNIDTLLRDVGSPVLSFDNYPILLEENRPTYFRNLERIRAKALEHDVPFWGFVLTAAHGGYREPTAAELRWMLFANLVYGARGIQHFVYYTTGNDVECFDAPVLGPGFRGDTYEEVKALNRITQALGRVLLSLRSRALFHVGPDNPVGTAAWPGTFDHVTRVEGSRLVLGFFKDKQGNDWLMVMNRRTGLPPVFEAPIVPQKGVAWDEWSHDDLAEGVTLGQAFKAGRPFDSLTVMIHRKKPGRHRGASLRLRRGGPNGTIVATHRFPTTHPNVSGIHFQFAEQPPGKYVVEMYGDLGDRVGWRTFGDSKIGGALRNGKPVGGKHRHLLVLSSREPRAQRVRLRLRGVTAAWEVSPSTGRFLRTPLLGKDPAAMVLETELRAGEGRLYRLVK